MPDPAVDLDSALMTRIREGDLDALRDVYLMYAGPLVGYINSIVRDPAASEDLVHDIFASIWERRFHWHPTTGIASYLYRSARNRALDYHEHLRVRARVEVVNGDDEISSIAQVESDQVGLDGLESRVRQALDKLPERRRLALTLRALHDMSYHEIAATLGITETAVRILVTRAREELRGLLGDDIAV